MKVTESYLEMISVFKNGDDDDEEEEEEEENVLNDD